MSRLNDFTDYPDGMVWNASLVMLNYFKTKMKDYWKGKKVIELGSGLGHLGWGLYQMGAHVVCTDTPSGDLKALRGRIENWLQEEEQSGTAQSGGSIRVVELTWGKNSWDASPLSEDQIKCDAMILAEVFSLPDYHEDLVWTVQKFAHENLDIWSIFLNRSFSFMFFALLADAGGFRVRQLPCEEVDLLGMEGEELGIFMHHTTFNPTSPRVVKRMQEST